MLHLLAKDKLPLSDLDSRLLLYGLIFVYYGKLVFY